MPTWSEILEELKPKTPGDPSPFDAVRKKYLAELHQITGRNVILYATKWMQGDAPPGFVSIVEEDLTGLMEVIHGLRGPELDLILHSPVVRLARPRRSSATSARSSNTSA